MKIHILGYDHRHDSDFRIERPSGSGDDLLLILKSPAVFTIDGQVISTEPDSFIVYTKDTPQHYGAAGVPYANDWCHFEMTEDERNFLAELGIPFNTPVRTSGTDEASVLMNALCREVFSDGPMKEISSELYLKLIFTKLSEKLMTREQKEIIPYYNELSELRSQIYNLPSAPWDAQMLAEKLSVSKSYFQHIYSKAFGISTANDIIRSRIEYSKYLLTSTDLPVSRISEMSGYSCEPHYIRQFRSRTGTTPSAFRKGSR